MPSQLNTHEHLQYTTNFLAATFHPLHHHQRADPFQCSSGQQGFGAVSFTSKNGKALITSAESLRGTVPHGSPAGLLGVLQQRLPLGKLMSANPTVDS